MLSAAAPAVTEILAEAGALPSGGGLASGTLAVALVGGLSAVVVALVPELFKMLRATPAALEALAATLRAEMRAAVAPAEASARRAERETRAIRRAVEAQHERVRDELEQVRDAVQKHVWRDHGRASAGAGPESGPIPAQRTPGPA